jgi:hypothetical protein
MEDREPKSGLSRRELLLLLLIGVLVGIALAYAGGMWLWTELEEYIKPNKENATFRKDVVQAFALIVAGVVGAIGAVVGLGGLYFSRQTLQHNQESLLANQQDEAQREYLKSMTELIVERGLTDDSSPYSPIRATARAQTLTVLTQVSGNRKRIILQFLREARLINRENSISEERTTYAQIVSLYGADLRYASLQRLRLSNITRTESVSLRGAILLGADLSGAILEGANLEETDLREADLSYANLSHADLRGAAFNGANLSGAHLGDVRGTTNEELEKQAKYLAGATMPNGQKYEDWLESNGRWENGEKSGPS